MAVKTDEIWSADDLAVSPVKELSTGGHAWDPNKIYQKETVVTEHDPGFHGQFSHKQFYSLADNNLGNDPMTDKVNWIEDNLVRYLVSDTTITVGTGGDFAQLDEAILYMSRYQMVDGKITTIRILAGHIIDYPMYFDGIKTQQMIIVSDTVVTIDCLAASSLPSMIILENSTLPIFDFDMAFKNGSTTNITFAAIQATNNSTLHVGKGDIQRTITVDCVSTAGNFGRCLSIHSDSNLLTRNLNIIYDMVGSLSNNSACIIGYSGSRITCYRTIVTGFIGNSAFSCGGASGFLSRSAINEAGTAVSIAGNSNTKLNYGVASTAGCTIRTTECNMRRNGNGDYLAGGSSNGGAGPGDNTFGDFAVRFGGTISKSANSMGGTNIPSSTVQAEGVIFNGDPE